MENESGGKRARLPESGFPSLNSDSPITGEGDNVKHLLGYSEVSFDDVIAMHLVDCDQCRDAIRNLRPVALGQKSGHCDTYWELQLMRAKFEGSVNNIVAYTEFGDQAQKGGNLE